MSTSTRWSHADRNLGAAVALAATVFSAPAPANHKVVAAPPLPPSVAALAPGLRAQGGGEMTVLGLSIYDGWFWGEGHVWRPDAPYLIDLHYHRSLDGARIAERSIAEIEGIGRGTPEERARWGEAMRRIFPSVNKDDRITGIHLPPGIVRYFLNGVFIGEIADPQFARAFFGIWLDPKSSRADFRRKLLGEAP
jgi:Chalcone isomerase-like